MEAQARPGDWRTADLRKHGEPTYHLHFRMWTMLEDRCSIDKKQLEAGSRTLSVI